MRSDPRSTDATSKDQPRPLRALAFAGLLGLAGCAGLIVFQDEVNLLSADLVPVAFEGKRGPGHLVHAQKFDVELTRGFQIFDHERDVIEGLNLHTFCRGYIGHEFAFLVSGC